MSNLSTEPYKGVRDFYPQDLSAQKYVFDVWRRVAESFGYVEYAASVLEPSELYRAKSGEEIVTEQTYTFIDRGDRDVTLRPEMTPTVARMVAGARQALPSPVRWYSIPNLFRYERPQRGRLREHWQLNVDAFGIKGLEAELELIEMAYRIMTAFGIKQSQFTIKVNSRFAFDAHFKAQGLDADQIKRVAKLIDRKKKIDDFDAKLAEIKPGLDGNVPEPVIIKELIERLSSRGVENVSYDPEVMRGFDYYTDVVFEVFDNHPDNNRSLFGGGRYDGLTGLFGVPDVPAAGFGMGDVTILDALATYGLVPEYRSTADVHLCVTDASAFEDASKLAAELRGQGVAVSVDYTGRKVGDQIKYAERLAIPHVVVVGPDELSSGQFKVKTLASREEKASSRTALAKTILG
jgi:histidyl-tRNA synthetase